MTTRTASRAVLAQCLLPFNHPIRLAKDLAVLGNIGLPRALSAQQQLSRGA